MSGIFNLAIEGLNDLLKLERFPDSEASIRIKEEHRKSCDPTRIFLEEAYKVVNPEYWTSTALMYSRYQGYCKANGYRAKNQGNFLDTVRFMFKGTTTKRIRNDRGEQITVAYGIELRTDYKEIEE